MIDLTAPVDVTHADCLAAAAGVRSNYRAARYGLRIDTWEPAPYPFAAALPSSDGSPECPPALRACSQQTPTAVTPRPVESSRPARLTTPGGARSTGDVA